MPDVKRIVQVMGWRSQQYGSFERFLVALTRACAERGIETDLVFQSEPPSKGFREDVAARIHVVPAAAQIGDPRHLARMLRLIGALRPQVMHAHFGYDAYNALLAARLLGVPRRFTTMHIHPHGPAWKLQGPRQRWLDRQVEVYFAVSHYVADQLEHYGVRRSHIEVCHLGVDPSTYRPDDALRTRTRRQLGVGADELLVLSTSHLRPGKGADLLPALGARLRARFPRVRLMLAGDGPLRESIAQEAERLGLDQQAFRLLGVREDVPGLLAAADLFLFPTQTTEGMGLGVLEALASEAPVVACRA
ncbi:MAG: glycosyltransferase, partial [Solirubrobacteraceae bacterium]